MDKRSVLFVLALVVSLFLINHYFDNKEQERRAAANARRAAATEAAKTQLVDNRSDGVQPTFIPTKDSSSSAPAAEQFYVLENDYQQLVFSNLGGALVEINLPLRSEANQKSVVKEINFDRVMQKDFPYNDRFPASTGKVGGYYPLYRRTIYKQNNEPALRVPPYYYGLNIVSDHENGAEVYQLKKMDKTMIQFESSSGNRRITKTYSFPKEGLDAPYVFDLSVKIDGDARGLSITTGVPEVELISGSSSPSLKYRITNQDKSKVEQIDLPKTNKVYTSIYPQWVSNSNGFLGVIIDPLTEIGSGFNAELVPGTTDPTRLTLIDQQYDLYSAKNYPGYQIRLPLRNSNDTVKFRVFAGPFDDEILKRVDATYTDLTTGGNPHYTDSQTFHGWFAFISEPFARFLFFLMKLFYQFTHSWGVSIILLTVALRVMLYPLNGWSIKSTARMQQVAPQVAAIQEKYKKEPKRAQMEIMALYREKGVNPFTGCFPILIQIPFLIGMFDLLKSTFALRGASFIPGWIDNLTAPDVLFTWSYPIYFFGNSFHLLPILLGAVMYVQQKFSSNAPKDANMMTDQQRQQKFMGNIMVVVFAVMFYKFPSGLNIYWLSSMLLGIVQQWYMTRNLPKPAIPAPKR